MQTLKLEERLRECAESLDNEDRDLTLKMKSRAKERREKDRKDMQEYVKKRRSNEDEEEETLAQRAGQLGISDKDK